MDVKDAKMDPNTVFLEETQSHAHMMKRMSTKATWENPTS